MRAAKSQGGLSVGHLRDSFTGLAHLRWVLTLSHVVAMNSALEGSQQVLLKSHRDCSEKHISTYYKMLQKLISWFTEFTKPVEKNDVIISLSTGHSRLRLMLTVLKIGRENRKGMDVKHLNYTIPTRNLKSLSNLQKKVRVGDQTTYVNNTTLFARLILLSEHEDFNLRKNLKHELTTLPTSLFDSNECKRKPD